MTVLGTIQIRVYKYFPMVITIQIRARNKTYEICIIVHSILIQNTILIHYTYNKEQYKNIQYYI